ncbi:MAG: hypothetical protein AABZ80_08830, partial [Gemmatimonadota bacterium]
MRSTRLAVALSAFALIGCAGKEPAADTTNPAASSGEKIGETAGMNVPESVRYDAELDVYYVANINGN